jgi:Outer membrane lipoprotein-sorting protein
MNLRSCAVICCALLLGPWPGAASAQESGRRLLDAVDKAMNLAEGRMRIRIEDHKASGSTRAFSAEVVFVLNQATLIEFVEPAREKGKRILTMGDSMWMSVPGTSRPLRLSGKDAFMGTSFTNDDVMNLDRSDDYDAVIAGEEPGGTRLVLTARKRSLPYPRMEMLVGSGALPVWEVLYTRSGVASKRIEFSARRDFGDKVRPSVMTMTDLMAVGDTSVVIFESMTACAVDRGKLSPTSFGK